MKRVSFLIVAALVFALLIPFGAAMAANEPSASPSYSPSVSPSYSPSVSPSYSPSVSPSYSPSATPTPNPSNNPAPAGTPGLSSGVPTGSELVGDETPVAPPQTGEGSMNWLWAMAAAGTACAVAAVAMRRREN